MITLVLLSGIAVVSLNMFLPSLAAIAAEFEADYALANLAIAGYAATTAVLQIVAGPLSDRFGRRPVILAALALFTLASLGCLFSTSIGSFLFFRMLQAAIITGYTVSMAVIRDTAPAQKAASLMGYLATAWALAPMLGPIAGGALGEFFGWRSNFLAFVVLALGLLALCWHDLGETNSNPSSTFRAQFRAYPELFRSRRFWGYSLSMAFAIGAFYAFLGGAPLVATAVLGLSPAELGLGMSVTTIGFVAGSALSGRFSAGQKLTTMVILGCAVSCAGLLFGLVLVLAGWVHVATIFGPCILVGVGNGLTMPSGTAGAMSVRPGLAGSASGLSGALMVGGGAVLSAATGALLTPEHAAKGLLAMMLLSSTLGLTAGLAVLWIDRREGPTVAAEG